MSAHTFFLQLLAILVSARLMGELAVRLKLPAVIGELLAGVILGPSLLGWLVPNEVIKLLAVRSGSFCCCSRSGLRPMCAD